MRPLNWSARVLKQSATAGPSSALAAGAGRASTIRSSARSTPMHDRRRRRRPATDRPSATPVRRPPISSSVVISSPSRYFSISASSRSATTSMRCSRAAWAALGQLVGDRAGGAGRVALGVGGGGHRDQVDHAAEARLAADRDLDRHGARARARRGRRAPRRSRRARGRACSPRSPGGGPGRRRGSRGARSAPRRRRCALTTISTASTARSAAIVSPWKEGSPGVSSRLTFTPFQVRWQSDAAMLMPRRRSSSSKSQTVVPSATRPRRVVLPAAKSIASTRLVLPLPRWPSTATFRSWAGSGCAITRAFPHKAGRRSLTLS